jgi:hypothetical protein
MNNDREAPQSDEDGLEKVRNVASSRGIIHECDLQHLHYMKAVIKETMRLHLGLQLINLNLSGAKIL